MSSACNPVTRTSRVRATSYEVIEDFAVSYITQWNLPYTGSGDTVLRTGDVLVALDPVFERALTGAFRPRDYAVLEARIVPLEIRSASGYDRFYLSIETVDLNGRCKRIIYS